MTLREIGLCTVGGVLAGLGAALVLTEYTVAAYRRRVEGMMTR